MPVLFSFMTIKMLLLLVYGLAVGCVLFWQLPSAAMSRSEEYLVNALHTPFFGFLLLILLLQFDDKRPGLTRVFLLFSVAIIMAVVVEVIQPFFRRTCALEDLFFAFVGCALVLVAYLKCRRGFPTVIRMLILSCGVVGVLLVLPVLAFLGDESRMKQDFPSLGSFESVIELTRWSANGCRLSRSSDYATDGLKSLRVEQVDDSLPYPGIFLVHGPKDWRGYKSLCFDVHVENSQFLALWVRVDDQPGNPPYADRGQLQVLVEPGSKHICLDLAALQLTPGGRKLDLYHIERFGLFWDSTEHRVDGLYLDHVVLRR